MFIVAGLGMFMIQGYYHAKVSDGKILQGETRLLNGVHVPVMLVGDYGYHLTLWFLKP